MQMTIDAALRAGWDKDGITELVQNQARMTPRQKAIALDSTYLIYISINQDSPFTDDKNECWMPVLTASMQSLFGVDPAIVGKMFDDLVHSWSESCHGKK